MKLYTVPVGLVEELWPQAGPMLARALEHHPYVDADDLLRILLAGHADLIVASEHGRIICAAVMEQVAYPGTMVGNVLALAGEFGIYRKHMDAITDYLEQWSRERGCSSIGMLGRPGWRKYVTRRGWTIRPCIAACRTL